MPQTDSNVSGVLRPSGAAGSPEIRTRPSGRSGLEPARRDRLNPPVPTRAITSELFHRVRTLIDANRIPNGDAPMVLATAAADGTPSARFVLLKEIDARGFVFYTNLESRKGRDLTVNPRAELLFYWPAVLHQLRIGGVVEKVDDATADAYWKTRARESQLSSAASPQSSPMTHAELAARIEALRKQCEGGDVPRPAHWTGLRLVPRSIEFWHAGEFRFHDRERFERGEGDAWEGTALAP